MVAEFQMIQVPRERESSYVLFEVHAEKGMVGEDLTQVSATLFIFTYNKYKKEWVWLNRGVGYEELKAIYKGIKGKKDRLDFYRWMKSMSPEAVQQRNEVELADAIRRVI